MENNKNILYIGLGILVAAVIVFWMLPLTVLRPVLYVILLVGSLFLILLVLIQRGRGGGLAGALGGMGGYSAFGTRAGDVFTRITIVAASIWILSAMALARINLSDKGIYENPGAASSPSPKGTQGAPAGSDNLETDQPSSENQPGSGTTQDAPPASQKDDSKQDSGSQQ